jgi:acyl carrier protein
MSPRPPAADIERQVIEIIEEALGEAAPARLTPETSFIGDLEMDSLTIVRIDMLIQGKLKLALAAEDIESIETIGDLVRALKERGQPV